MLFHHFNFWLQLDRTEEIANSPDINIHTVVLSLVLYALQRPY